MNTGPHISPEDLALYAMQLASPEEAAKISQHLEQCPECRQELQAATRDLALYAMTAEMHSPPALARQRLTKQVARERRAVVAIDAAQDAPQQTTFSGRGQGLLSSFDAEETPRRNMLGVVMGWTGWAVAAGLTFFTLNLYHQREALEAAQNGQQQLIARLNDEAAKARSVSEMLSDTSAMHVTLTPAKLAAPAVPTARVIYQPNKGMLILQANNMESLQTYKTYELWLIPADGRDPIPAGTFHPDVQGNVSMVTAEVQKGVIAKEFGITVEDEGGSKTPTAPILMVGM